MPCEGKSGRPARPGLGATSYLLLATQILSLGHLLLARHITCPKHGDVVHAEQPHEGTSTGLAKVKDSSAQPALANEATRVRNEHDHCRILTNTRERFALLPPVREPAASVEFSFSSSPAPAVAPYAPVDLIVLSPKNSPPAV